MTKTIKQKRITSRDVAARAGVSQSTVSRVLGSEEASSFISEETAQRVKEAAQEMGYSPNPIARALRGEKTNLIGLIVREIADPFFADLIEVLSFRFRREGLNMILGHVHSDADEGMQIARVLDSRQCDGMIFLGDLRDDMKYIKAIMNEGHPAITMCRGSQIESIPSINCNNAAGMNMLIDHLMAYGHKHLAFVDGGYIGDLYERQKTFLKLKERFPDMKLSLIQAEKNNFEGGYKAMQMLMKEPALPTAVMAADDSMAVGILHSAREAGINVPQQMSVTGFDDIDLAKYAIPALTTVQQPLEEMADEAYKMISKLIDKKPLHKAEMYMKLEPKLVVRESTSIAITK